MTGTVVVAGAAGFVGRRIVAALARRGSAVRGLVRPGGGSTLRHRNVVEVPLHGYDDAAIGAAIGAGPIDGIINLAAYGVHPAARDPLAMQSINVDLAAGLVRAAAHVGAVVVQAGSSAEYARPLHDHPLIETDALESGKLYGASKAAGGLLALATAVSLAVPMRHLRLFNVYGPGEADHRLIPTLVAHHAAGTRAALSEGRQRRDFLFVDDCVDGLLRAFDRLRSGATDGARALNLCTGIATTVRDFVDHVARVLRSDRALLGFGDVPMRPDEVPVLVGDPTAMAFDLDWRPHYGPTAGIAATLGGGEAMSSHD